MRVGDDERGAGMQKRGHSLGKVRLEIDALDCLGGEQGRSDRLVRAGTQPKGQPFEMRRIVVWTRQGKSVSAKRLVRLHYADRRGKAFITVDEGNELAIRGRDHER